ncbi:Ig-like domain repeat protein [Paenibacillus sp. 1P07SE]|uniref:Ig-like domain repeat protein n=1 Tax=Paenibacillus sp. 1P07SE TaxID=3132209 RepID=UPI0039A6D2AA
MRKQSLGKRLLAAALIMSMFVMLFPVGSMPVAYAAADREVFFGKGVRIGNATYAAQNSLINFYQNDVPGFSHPIKPSQMIDWDRGNIRLGYNDKWETARFVINVAQNPELRQLAQSGEAEVLIGFNSMIYYSGFLSWTRVTRGSIVVDGQTLFSGQTPKGGIGKRDFKAKIHENSVITVEFAGEGRRYKDNGRLNGVEGLYIKFQDTVRPVLEDYDLTGTGAQRVNTVAKHQEMFIKQQENLTLSYKFSEPVQPFALNSGFYDHFTRHPLFVNIPGTGLPAAGQQQYMQNMQYQTAADLSKYTATIDFRYTGSRYHQSPGYIEPKMIGGQSGAPIDWPMEEKLKTANLSDAAGNAVQLRIPRKKLTPQLVYPDASGELTDFMTGLTDDPFNPRRFGFAVTIDGVAPKYTKVGNGIQPEILTGVNINKNDKVEFTLQLTEEAVVKRGWDPYRTYIHLNNGMKAYYVAGENTKDWTFEMEIPAGKTVETPLLKVIAISHDQKAGGTDMDVIQDYAGNLLIQPANFDGEHVDGAVGNGDVSLVNSKIDWAKLIIDNTPPMIDYRYQQGGATGQQYQKTGTITVDANDPHLLIPSLDPVPGDRGSERPSMGIFRPSNMTGEGSPSVGLIYYWWSKSPEDPLAGKEADQFAAVKRYSLSGKQPSQGLYEGYEHLQFSVVNNKNNLIAPPPEAIASGTAGPWYLHTWTADMTWDSARELMQYEKMKDFKRLNEELYNQWKAELQGSDISDADREIHADKKALQAVGDYGNLQDWPISDFTREDSNWTYKHTSIMLDNAAPVIMNTATAGDNTMDVQMTVSVEDEHSGLAQADYQWVRDGGQPSEIEWQEVELHNGQATLRTLGEVFEDGDYRLYIKASDRAGNSVVWPAEKAVTVSSLESVHGEFLTPANPDYVQSMDVFFRLSGILPDKVAYAVSSSANRPSAESAYTELQATTGMQGSVADGSLTEELEVPESGAQQATAKPDKPEVSIQSAGSPSGQEQGDGAVQTGDGASDSEPKASENGQQDGGSDSVPQQDSSANPDSDPDARQEDDELVGPGLPVTAAVSGPALEYAVPLSDSLNGIHYVHMMVKQGDRYYYFSKAYYLDNEAPLVTFNKRGVDYPREKQDVTVTVTENYSKNNMDNKYLWVMNGDPAPDAATQGWQPLPSSGVAVIDGSALEPGAVADYKLYVWATDGAGNMAIVSTESTFKVTRPAGAEEPPAPGSSDLIYLFGDAQDGYTAILKLNLETVNKQGYEYSVSPDKGQTWTRWKPYTNFVSLSVPTGRADQLQVQVKYRAPSGSISDPKTLDITKLSKDEPIYGLATHNTTRPVMSDKGVNIEVMVPLGIRVVPAAVNPSAPTRSGNVFNVKENGYYAFDLLDLSDPNRKDVLYVVVSNIDNEAPRVSIEYNITAPTNSNVTARIVDSSEPIVMVNNDGRNAYTFEANGTFLFQFRDEAGNVGTAEASVGNISKEAPRVRIVRSYGYGENGSLTFGTIRDGNGNVLFSSGVTLGVEPENGNQRLFFPDMKNMQTLYENGTATFVVADENGNTTVIEETIDTIRSGALEPSISYTFVDDNGEPVNQEEIVTIGGQRYAKGKVQVTLAGSIDAPNQVFSGLRPIENDNGQYTNRISDQDGSYTYARAYATNGTTTIGLSDLLGNSSRVPVVISGLDNTPPELTLHQESVGVLVNKEDFDFRTDLGGFTVSDNLSAAADIKVDISELDLTTTGTKMVTYTATDQVGNITQLQQKVVVTADGGMLISGNGTIISSAYGETALFNTNVITFKVTGFNQMLIGGNKETNEWGTFDLLYQPGLYREGQMKYIAQKVSYKELVSGQYKVTFPQVGWYTIIVRNQEREREYATFFVGKMQ